MSGWMFLAKLLVGTADFAGNPLGDALEDMSAGERLLTFLAMAPQLFGEELFSVLPFLALLYWLYHGVHLSRRAAIVVSWLATMVLFGAAHLPTYDWNLGRDVTHAAQAAAGSHANPSGSVHGPASPPMVRRCDPVPSGETPASLARARRP